MGALADWLVVFSVQVAITVSVASIGDACVALPAAFKLHYWRAVLVGTLLLAVPAAVGIPVSAVTFDARSAVSFVMAQGTGASSWPLSNMIAMGWLCGVVASAAWLAIGFLALRRLRHDPAAVSADETLSPPDIQGSEGIAIQWHPGVTHPVSFGILRPVILLPSSVRTLPRGARKAVIHHEVLHVVRRDWAWHVAEEVVRAILWFHPGLWWVIDRIRLSREETIDEIVARDSGHRTYMEILMHFADTTPPSVPALGFGRRHLLRRMKALAESTPKKTIHSRTGVILGSLLAASLVAASTLSGQERVITPDEEGVTGPSVVRRVQPAYTQPAIDAGIEGEVRLTAVVRPDGTLDEIRVIESLDVEFGLDDAAVDAAAQWRFEPGTVNGEPVAVEVTLEFRYTLP